MYDENGQFYKPDRGSTPMPDHIMLSFCGDAKTEIAVTWRTDVSAGDGYVLFASADGTERRADAVCRTIESDIDISKFNTARLQGLTPGTTYRYTCGDDRHRSDLFTFTTQEAACETFKFLVISDHQCGLPWEHPDYSGVQKMLLDALERDPDVRFILTAGDNCDDGQNELQWNGMFSGMEGIAERLPYMMATGNHDNRGFRQYLPQPPQGNFYLDHADFFDTQFRYAYPQNGPAGFETENYSFDYGNVHFCIMGINEPAAVADWAYDDIRATEQTWKLGAYHFPIYPAIPEGQNDDGYPWLRKAVESCDLVFEGHEHTFARTYPIRGDAMFTRPSEGTVHYQCGTGSGGRGGNERKIWHTAFYPQPDTPVYTLVEINGSRMTVTTLTTNGDIADQFSIDKTADRIEPPSLPPRYCDTRMMYKGSMPHLCTRGTCCEQKDGVWFAPFAVLAQYIGADVRKEPGKATVTMFGITAVFTEGRDTAQTNAGDVPLGAAVYRAGNQLMIPAQTGGQIFNIRCTYIAHNNILDFESEREESPLSPQP